MKSKTVLENFNKFIIKKDFIYLIAFFWGFAEGIFFFIIPDIFLSLIVLFSFKKGWISAFITLCGSLSGALVMYYFISPNININEYLLNIPLINMQLIDKATVHLNTGSIGVILGPTVGAPHKIYSLLAGQLNLPIISYIFYSGISRLLRFMTIVFGTNGIRKLVNKYITKSLKIHVLFHFISWIFIYIGYFILTN